MNKYFLLLQKNEKKPSGKILVSDNFREISEKIIVDCYSVGFYNPPKRTKYFWRKSNILAFDIDDEQPTTMKNLQEKLKDIKYIIAPSKSHRKIKGNKGPCDRYRLLVFLDEYIWDYQSYKKYAQKFAENFEFIPDKRSMDATHLFFPSQYVEKVNDIGKLFNIECLGKQDESVEVENEKEFEYILSKSEISPKLQEIINSKSTKPMRAKSEKFIRMLLAQTNLVGKDPNIDEFIGQGRNILPQVTIAKFIGVDAKTLRKWIYELIENELLFDFDPDYKGGASAKYYKALGELKENIIKSYYESVGEVEDLPLPTKIEEGEWNDVLFRMAFRFKSYNNPEEYYKWAKSVKGFSDKPERKIQMENSWKNMKKYYKNDID